MLVGAALLAGPVPTHGAECDLAEKVSFVRHLLSAPGFAPRAEPARLPQRRAAPATPCLRSFYLLSLTSRTALHVFSQDACATLCATNCAADMAQLGCDMPLALVSPSRGSFGEMLMPALTVYGNECDKDALCATLLDSFVTADVNCCGPKSAGGGSCADGFPRKCDEKCAPKVMMFYAACGGDVWNASHPQGEALADVSTRRNPHHKLAPH